MSKVKTTTRKFYNKWMYKVTLAIPGVAILRTLPLDKIEEELGRRDPVTIHPRSSIAKAILNKATLIGLGNILLKYGQDTWTKRIESNWLDVYTNDVAIYKELCEVFDAIIPHCFEPEDPSVMINSSSVMVKKLPHGKYKYKVFLLPHKMKDVTDKHMYINWLEGQSEKIRISEAVKKWFIATNWNWDRRYVLVEDESTLLMLKLRGADVVGQIHDYVIVE